ncbi:small nuclear RNA activating complex, subunit SNAP43-domain-containing protein [Pavlovales sp. CCMP2436]|nr:small nuclear RNA activating complex, subunit SNAP43-domain-containing protein [Pavlovales sp. CCMP2436]
MSLVTSRAAAAAAFRDVSRLIRQFARQESDSFSAFREVWSALSFSKVHYARPAGEDGRRFVSRLLAFALAYVSHGHSYFVRLGGLYALYTLHATQYCALRARCRVTPAQWASLVALLREASAREGVQRGRAEASRPGPSKPGPSLEGARVPPEPGCADAAHVLARLCAEAEGRVTAGDAGALCFVYAYTSSEMEAVAVRCAEGGGDGGARREDAGGAEVGTGRPQAMEETAGLLALDALARCPQCSPPLLPPVPVSAPPRQRREGLSLRHPPGGSAGAYPLISLPNTHTHTHTHTHR